jgi:dTDP-4-amino-4,6-dideoxygalactose transaminase
MKQTRTPKSIPLSKAHLDDTDEEQLRAAIHSGWLTQNGTEVKLMEDRLDRFFFQKNKRIELSKGIISLPTFPELSNGELNYILESIMDYTNVRQR